MKRTLLVFLAIALVGSFAFAEVTGIDAPTVSGSVTTTYGVDLDNGASGFNNSTSVNVVVPLAGGSDTGSGSGDIYAEITIDEIEISTNTDDADWEWDADIGAKIVMGSFFVGLNNPDLEFNNVDLDQDLEVDDDPGPGGIGQEVDDDRSIDVNADAAGNDGISFGYMSDAFTIEIGIASKEDGYEDDVALWVAVEDDVTSWVDSNETDADNGQTDANTTDAYIFGGNASIMAGPLTLPVWFVYDTTYNGVTPLMVGMGAAPSVAMGDFTLDVPVDYVALGAEYGFEADPMLSYAIAGVGTVAVDVLYAKYDITSVSPVDPLIIDAAVTFTEDFDDALGLIVEVSADGLGNDIYGWNFNIDASYDLGIVAPYVTVDYGQDEDLDLSVGATLAVIDNATVTLDYTNGHVLDGATVDSAEKGRVTVAVEVSY